MAARAKRPAAIDYLTMHDPAALRLTLAAVYAAGAILAALAAVASRGRDRTFWALAAVVLATLTVAKELQLLDDLSRAARASVKAHGWYGVHRRLQEALAIVLMLVGLAGAAVAARVLRSNAASVKWAAAALLLLLGFLILRAISIHAVDVWTTSAFAGMRKGWWVELAAMLVICLSAAGAAARRSRMPH